MVALLVLVVAVEMKWFFLLFVSGFLVLVVFVLFLSDLLSRILWRYLDLLRRKDLWRPSQSTYNKHQHFHKNKAFLLRTRLMMVTGDSFNHRVVSING